MPPRGARGDVHTSPRQKKRAALQRP